MSFVLQYRLPFDVAELGKAGDVITYYPDLEVIERTERLPEAARETAASIILHLEPIGPSVHPAAAAALLRATRQPAGSRHLQLLRESACG